jgi:hypothetical protein
MAECGSPSTYCENGAEWTYHCAADEGHEPGQHVYVLDDGQTPPSDGSA